MARVSIEEKARLMELGSWPDFVKERQDMVDAGATSSAANRACLEKYLGVKRGTGGRKKAEDGGEREAGGNPIALSSYAGGAGVPAGYTVPEAHKARLSDFEGKTCGPVETVRWVMANMRAVDVKPTDAPSGEAWTLWTKCQASEAYSNAFSLQVWPKIIPTRSQLDDGKDETGERGVITREFIEELVMAAGGRK